MAAKRRFVKTVHRTTERDFPEEEEEEGKKEFSALKYERGKEGEIQYPVDSHHNTS